MCKEETEWAYLDIGHQHLDCDSYPTEDGNVVIIRGEEQEEKD